MQPEIRVFPIQSGKAQRAEQAAGGLFDLQASAAGCTEQLYCRPQAALAGDQPPAAAGQGAEQGEQQEKAGAPPDGEGFRSFGRSRMTALAVMTR